MSDTSAPAPSAAPAPQPASQPALARAEVPINQSPPPHAPRPIPSQAVPAPDKANGRSNSIRESLEAAFERSQTKQPTGARPERAEPKAAEAKAGHNQPPEETPKLDLKKRPDEQPQAQPRDKGRFAPRSSENSGQDRPIAANTGQSGQPDQQPYKRLPPHAPYAEPPPRMAEHGKRDWADTPETVRGEVARMHSEYSKAAQQYQGIAAAFQPIAHFHDMALRQGTTLAKALTDFVGIENKLREDPIAGLDTIVRNLGMTDPQTGKHIDLRDVAYHVLSQSPEQLKQVQQGNVQQAAQHQIGALHREISGLKQYLNQMHNQQQFTYTRSAVDQFADSHPRFDELGLAIEQELKAGFDLPTAYRRAELLNPATHAAQTRDPSAQTRQTDRSIYGSPDVAPSNGASRRTQKASGSPREALENAMKRLNG